MGTPNNVLAPQAVLERLRLDWCWLLNAYFLKVLSEPLREANLGESRLISHWLSLSFSFLQDYLVWACF